MIQLCIDNNWLSLENNDNIIFVIVPGAGTYRNKLAYQCLEKNYRVIYIGKSGSEYDKYPDNWQNNGFVESNGYHLGGIYQLVKEKISKKIIPSAIICGSRGGQVTIGKIWESLWRGPTIMFNAGSLTTQTIIPKGVSILFIIMELDYFKSVNNPSKVKYLFDKFRVNEKIKMNIIYLKNHYHMPNLNLDLRDLLVQSYKYMNNHLQYISLPIDFY